jgi:hypothetical protein
MPTLPCTCVSNSKVNRRVKSDLTGETETLELWEVTFKAVLLDDRIVRQTSSEIEAQGFTVGKVYRLSFDSG